MNDWAITRSVRGLPVGNASDRAAYGMWGTVPTPSSAIACLRMSAWRRVAHSPADGPPRSPYPRRKPRTPAVRWGSERRTACSASLGRVFLGCERGISPPSAVGADETPSLTSRCSPSGIRPNKATCCTGPDQSGSCTRTSCRCALSPARSDRTACAIGLCTPCRNSGEKSESLRVVPWSNRDTSW